MMKINVVLGGLLAAGAAEQCCLDPNQEISATFCNLAGYTIGSACPEDTECCDITGGTGKLGPGAPGNFECCGAGKSCQVCQLADNCDFLDEQTHLCKDAPTPDPTAEPETGCDECSTAEFCCSTDGSNSAGSFVCCGSADACVTNSLFENYCNDAPTPAPPTPAPATACTTGRGEKDEHYKKSKDNSKAACESICKADSLCAGFDFTTRSGSEACRLYKAGTTPRLGSGANGRQWCVVASAPEPTPMPTVVTPRPTAGPRPTPQPTDAPAWQCQQGRGEKNNDFKKTRDNSERACASACIAEDDCEHFDFTIKSQSDSCRLYRAGDSPRLGSSDRQYCSLDLAPAPTPLPANWDCDTGRGQKGKAFDRSKDNSEESCGQFCAETEGCEGFDYTTSPQSDACRVFKANTPREGGGDRNRKYCTAAAPSTRDSGSAWGVFSTIFGG